MRPCDECGEPFSPPNGNAKICSKRCEYLRREKRRMINCTECGGPMWKSRTVADKPVCRPCRRLKPGYRMANMRAKGVVQTWDCLACGKKCTRPATKGQRPKWCEECRRIKVSSGRWIPSTTRRAIYDRDNWTCGICLEPVDRSLIGTPSIWRPSLDHIIPRSVGGGHEPENLRLAHLWCNSARSDERTYSDGDFQAA